MEILELTASNLRKHGFEAETVSTLQDAAAILERERLKTSPVIFSYGDSVTVRKTGLIEKYRGMDGFLDGFDKDLPRQENLKIRRKALMSDFFFTGVNAIISDGRMVWLDMIGNRISPVIFGPERVVILAGRNKIVGTQDEAVKRIKTISAPQNAIRHVNFRTPCQKTGVCMDCNSKDRICSSWLIMERCVPAGRIMVVLIDEDLGF